jgi:hypothetical protein
MEKFDRVTEDKCRNCVQHVKELEAKMWTADEIDSVIISVGETVRVINRTKA